MICPICEGSGEIKGTTGKGFDVISFLVPVEIMPEIMKEINRIIKIAGINTRHPALNRGLALEYICQNSAQTPMESLI